MDNLALTPSADDLLLDESEIVEAQAVDAAIDLEKQLAALSTTGGWQRIAAQMQTDIDAFRTGRNLTIDPDTDLATIGQRFVIASTVAAHLQSYLDMVNNAREAVIEAERRKASSPAAE